MTDIVPHLRADLRRHARDIVALLEAARRALRAASMR
jgi:hypothetical protein